MWVAGLRDLQERLRSHARATLIQFHVRERILNGLVGTTGQLALQAVDEHDATRPLYVHLCFQAVHTPYDRAPGDPTSNVLCHGKVCSLFPNMLVARPAILQLISSIGTQRFHRLPARRPRTIHLSNRYPSTALIRFKIFMELNIFLPSAVSTFGP